MQRMAERGWVCVAVNYRLAPRDAFPAQIVDVKKAIAWVKEHIEEYGGDPSYVVITGGSAGGHLASLAALTPNDPEYQPGFEGADTRVQAAVPFYGVYDFAGATGLTNALLMRDRYLAPKIVQRTWDDDPEVFEHGVADPADHLRRPGLLRPARRPATRWSPSSRPGCSSRRSARPRRTAWPTPSSPAPSTPSTSSRRSAPSTSSAPSSATSSGTAPGDDPVRVGDARSPKAAGRSPWWTPEPATGWDSVSGTPRSTTASRANPLGHPVPHPDCEQARCGTPRSRTPVRPGSSSLALAMTDTADPVRPARTGPHRARLHARRRGAGPAPPRPGPAPPRPGRRDRQLLREVGGLPRRRRARGRRSGVHRRPPPRLGGEPGRLGAPRPDTRRPRHRTHRHPALLPAHHRGGRARGRGGGRRRRLHDRGRPLALAASRCCSSTAGTATSRPMPTTTAGRAG